MSRATRPLVEASDFVKVTLQLRHAERLNDILFKIVQAVESRDPDKFREDADLTAGENAILAAFMSDRYLEEVYREQD